MSLKNKVFLITGASSGIGAAIAIHAAKQGADVILVGRNETKITKVANEVELITGKKPLVILADVSKDEDVKKIAATTLEKHGKLDVLINNAGVGKISDILDENALELFDFTMNTNLRSAVHLTHLCAPHLIKTKGNIVNISSVAALRPTKIMWAYCVSKAGMDHFTRCMASSLAARGVRVNSVNPGPVMTDFAQNNGLGPEELAKMSTDPMLQAAPPLRRISDPLEVAEIVLFLASDKAVGVTGSVYTIDNGLALC